MDWVLISKCLFVVHPFVTSSSAPAIIYKRKERTDYCRAGQMQKFVGEGGGSWQR